MKKSFTQNKSLYLFATFCFSFLLQTLSQAQVVLTRDMYNYTQDFNSLPASGTGVWESGTFYLPGWKVQRTTTTNSLLTGTGSSNTGGLYSFGQSGSSDRALGAISSATSTVGQFSWGLLIQNNTGKTITFLTIDFTGEQWRSASKTAGKQATTFWYSQSAATPDFDLSPTSDKGWTSVPELDFYSLVNFSAAGALNGNLPANRTTLLASIQVEIPQGHYFMLRWKDLNDLDDDHGLAIDDFSITWDQYTAGPTPMPVELVSFTSALVQQHVKLDWATASEYNSSHFIVERSIDGNAFNTVGKLSSKGFSSQKTYYTFFDDDPIFGVSYYRLKQVDLDGSYEYSKLLVVKRAGPASYAVYPTVTTGELNLKLPLSLAETRFLVYDKMGRLVRAAAIPSNSTSFSLNVGHLQNGKYFLVIFSEEEPDKRQVFKVIKR